MKTKFIFSTLMVGLLLICEVQSSKALPSESHDIQCDPHPEQICVTIHSSPSPMLVPGIFVDDSYSTFIPYDFCTVGFTSFTDIFVHGQGLVGNGTGYVNVEGCAKISPPTIKFSTDSESSLINNYQTWYNTVFQQ